MTSLAEQKNTLRQEALRRRRAMDPVARVEAGLALAHHAQELPLPAGAIVAGFWPIRDEIDPRPLLESVRSAGHQLCLPVVVEPHLIFRAFYRDSVFEPAGFGTYAPGADGEEVRPDVLLMPLAAFDGFGNRIGYGKGHYDKALAALEVDRKVHCIGVAFGLQEVASVPAEPHDRPLDGILTEAGYRRFSNL
ncbi:5-formyltetrahydrofolate cyclo-ligase [Roseibium limicola]|uniref:5-formyltetrahydrofolate cyclo-ligase n=1 Tax=Roseibium limicola TaxID=2816037 RepID=A0A939ESQ9_9HYPH|nr:5-formyltetrahydrofolate cyclo-ligase [Roseibium limicola]MBO0346923.1 5-formyltetrahydrofolate cyclo-ligase [Roseibium limicola]